VRAISRRVSRSRKRSLNWWISVSVPDPSRESTVSPSRSKRSGAWKGNIINNTEESLEWVKAVNDANIQLMVDFYHFEIEKEDTAVLAKAKDHFRHIHMANPENRVMTLKWEEYNYGPFFAALRAIGYDQLVGLEASSKDLPHDGPLTVQLLRKALRP